MHARAQHVVHVHVQVHALALAGGAHLPSTSSRCRVPRNVACSRVVSSRYTCHTASTPHGSAMRPPEVPNTEVQCTTYFLSYYSPARTCTDPARRGPSAASWLGLGLGLGVRGLGVRVRVRVRFGVGVGVRVRG